jgi:predicted metal-dependent enzyme (double-stranded beta helix superfamily)
LQFHDERRLAEAFGSIAGHFQKSLLRRRASARPFLLRGAAARWRREDEPMGIERLRSYIRDMTRLVEGETDESALLSRAREAMAALVAHDDWLPDAFARPNPERYQQYLLWCDPYERFSLVSFVWGPGQKTPVHDHLTWGVIGMLRGAERCVDWSQNGAMLAPLREHVLQPRDTCAVSPTIGDIHEVMNAVPNRASVSIHVYGGNIGAIRRHVFAPATGERRDFVSGYSEGELPNIWTAA